MSLHSLPPILPPLPLSLSPSSLPPSLSTGPNSHTGSSIPRASEIPIVWLSAVLCLQSVWVDRPGTIPPQGMGFRHCQHVVYHSFQTTQFTTFNDTIETLFSLLNGDDIYNTYILLTPGVDLAAYIYSRFFLYIFLGLFIYSVLNLFTSLIISAYEISQVGIYSSLVLLGNVAKYRTRTRQQEMRSENLFSLELSLHVGLH